MQKELDIRSIVFTGLMTALVYISTVMFLIPIPTGFIHMGDFTIFLSVLLLGTKRAVFASGVGMFLVNILSGAFHWAPFTLIIKGSMALISGYIISKKGNDYKTCLIAFVSASIFMVIGYFFASIFIASFLMEDIESREASIIFAMAGIFPNIIQVSAAVLVAMPMVKVIQKIKRLKD